MILGKLQLSDNRGNGLNYIVSDNTVFAFRSCVVNVDLKAIKSDITQDYVKFFVQTLDIFLMMECGRIHLQRNSPLRK